MKDIADRICLRRRRWKVPFWLLALLICTAVLAGCQPHGCVYEWETEASPRCTEPRFQFLRCSVCGEIKEAQRLSTQPHEGIWYTAVEPTCDAAGEEQLICEVCGMILETRELPPTDHTPGEWIMVTEASCTAAGARTLSCAVCGTLLNTEEIPAEEHHFPDVWDTMVSPTCTENGKQTRSCIVCGITEEHLLPASGHALSEWVIISQPSCQGEGLRSRTCQNCDYEESAVLPAAGHNWGAWTEAGTQQKRICSICGTAETQNIIPSLVMTSSDPKKVSCARSMVELADRYGNVSFAYLCPETGDSVSYRASESYTSQCTIKVAYCQYLLYSGVDLSDTIRYSILYGTSEFGFFREDNVGTDFTVQELIGYSLTYSDNQSYMMLVNTYGRSGFNDFLENVLGVSSFHLPEGAYFGYTNVADEMKMLDYVYRHEAENPCVVDAMKKSIYTGRIAAGTPYKTALKHGFNGRRGNHEIAIIYAPEPYLLVIMSDAADAMTPLFEELTELAEQYHAS